MLIQIAPDHQRFLLSLAVTMGGAVRRGGAWIACKPGCSSCCLGPFPITQLDAMRLRQGLEELERKDAAIAQEVRRRARLYLENADLPEEALDRIPCPALDPATGLCDLYDWRPVTCRTFGPATHAGQGVVATCDLCFEGASQEEIASCAVEIDPEGLERALLERLENQGIKGETQVAAALI